MLARYPHYPRYYPTHLKYATHASMPPTLACYPRKHATHATHASMLPMHAACTTHSDTPPT